MSQLKQVASEIHGLTIHIQALARTIELALDADLKLSLEQMSSIMRERREDENCGRLSHHDQALLDSVLLRSSALAAAASAV